jgi:hypothetical protein
VERWDVGLGGQAEGEDRVGHDAENRTAKWAESVMRETHSGKYALWITSGCTARSRRLRQILKLRSFVNGSDRSRAKPAAQPRNLWK